MASKKNSGSGKESDKLAAAAEELMKAAELIKQQAGASSKPAAKKSPAKKAPAKKPAAKKEEAPAAEKAEPKKSAPKKSAPKKKEPKEEPVKEEEVLASPAPEEPKEEPKEEPVAEEPAPAPEEPKEEPVAEEPKEGPKEEPAAEEPAPAPEEPKEEPAAEEPKEEEPKSEITLYCRHCGAANPDGYQFCKKCGKPRAGVSAPAEEEPKDEPKEEAAAAADSDTASSAAPAKSKGKIGGAISKGKLPIFIIVNALFLVCSILLMKVSFNISATKSTGKTTFGYTLFSYLGNAATIKHLLAATAGTWNSGAYTMIGIFMFIAFLVPLALVVKNLILFFVKKNKSIYKFDAIVVFAFMLFYITLVNFYGANVPAGPMIAFIVGLADLAFTIFADLILNRKNGQKLPIFSMTVTGLVIVCEFLFTSLPVFTKGKGEYYGAAAASQAGGFMFVTYFIAVAALIALVVVQLWKLPKLLELILPGASALCALLTLIVAGAGKPAGYSMGGGFVFACILTLLVSAAYIVFTLVPALKKFKVQFDSESPSVFGAAATEKE